MKDQRQNKLAFQNLKVTIDTYISDYEKRRYLYNEFPKVDIPLVFSLWDEFLTKFDAEKAIKGDDVYWKDKETKQPHILQGESIDTFNEVMGKSIGEKFHVNLNLAQNKIRNWDSFFKLQEGIETAFGNGELYGFFIHDIEHLSCDMSRQFWDIFYPRSIESETRMRYERPSIQQFLEDYNKNPENYFGNFMESVKMVQFLVNNKLGEPIPQTNFKPAELAKRVAMILKNRHHQQDWGITQGNISNSKRNEIVLDCEDFELLGNSGVIFSSIYNLAKNSYKKVEGEKNQSYKLFIQIYQAPFSNYVITIGDTGKPIDLNIMKDLIRNEINDKGIDNIHFSSSKMKNRYSNWKKSDYKVTQLNVEDITNIAFMARMTGFDNNDDFSSGMGLYGVKHLVDDLGGKILYGESFENGGPIFTLVIPKKIPTNKAEKYTNSFATSINQTRLYHGLKVA